MWLTAALFLLWQAAAGPLDEGRKALSQDRFADAATLFQKAVHDDPADYAAHFHLALAYSLSNDDTRAIPEYRKTLELKPGLYQAQLNLGISLLRAGQPGDAVAPLEQAYAQKPAEAQPRLKLAAACLALNRFADAEKYYSSGPATADSELGLAKAIAAQNRLDEAAPHFRNAASLDPKFRDALLDLAGRYEQAKQPAEAIAIYRQFPENAGAQERLGELLLEQKQFADAIPRLEQAVQQSPTVANRVALATAYGMNQEPEKQAALLAQAAASEPANFDLHMLYGRQLRDRRKFPPAAQQFFAAAQLRPDAVEAWNELAGVLIVGEDYARGLAALDKVKALGKETPGNQYLRAITLDRLKQLKPALESYQQFLASDGGAHPEQEFAARQRARILRQELNKK